MRGNLFCLMFPSCILYLVETGQGLDRIQYTTQTDRFSCFLMRDIALKVNIVTANIENIYIYINELYFMNI